MPGAHLDRIHCVSKTIPPLFTLLHWDSVVCSTGTKKPKGGVAAQLDWTTPRMDLLIKVNEYLKLLSKCWFNYCLKIVLKNKNEKNFSWWRISCQMLMVWTISSEKPWLLSLSFFWRSSNCSKYDVCFVIVQWFYCLNKNDHTYGMFFDYN